MFLQAPSSESVSVDRFTVCDGKQLARWSKPGSLLFRPQPCSPVSAGGSSMGSYDEGFWTIIAEQKTCCHCVKFMPFHNLRQFLELLRQEQDLITIDVEVDPYLEAAEIHRRVINQGGPALNF